MKLSPSMTADDLRAWRTDRALTRRQLSIDLGVTETTIFRWEQASRHLPPFLWLALRALACRAQPTERRV